MKLLLLLLLLTALWLKTERRLLSLLYSSFQTNVCSVGICVFEDPEEEIQCIEQGATYAGGLKVIKMVTFECYI